MPLSSCLSALGKDNAKLTAAALAAAVAPYKWIALDGCTLASLFAIAIGANSVMSTSFGTAVAAKSLTLRQATRAAALLSMLGAIVLVPLFYDTKRFEIVDVRLYRDEPQVLLMGLYTSLLTGTVVLLVMTSIGLPVSPAHTINACFMGFAWATKGATVIEQDLLTKIVISWIASPLLAGGLAFAMYGVIRLFILKQNRYNLRFYVFPIVLSWAMLINTMFMLERDMRSRMDWPFLSYLKVSCSVAALFLLLWIFDVGPAFKQHVASASPREAPPTGSALQLEHTASATATTTPTTAAREEESALGQDLLAVTRGMSRNAKAASDVFDLQAEQVFGYLHIFTAGVTAFVHGVTDGINAIGPMCLLMGIWLYKGQIRFIPAVQTWNHILGGLFLLLGIYLFGHRVTKTIGFKITALSPSSGVCAQLAASLSVLVAPFLHVQPSFTAALCGALVGVGLAKGGVRNVHWRTVRHIWLGWMVSFADAALLSSQIYQVFALLLN